MSGTVLYLCLSVLQWIWKFSFANSNRLMREYLHVCVYSLLLAVQEAISETERRTTVSLRGLALSTLRAAGNSLMHSYWFISGDQQKWRVNKKAQKTEGVWPFCGLLVAVHRALDMLDHSSWLPADWGLLTISASQFPVEGKVHLYYTWHIVRNQTRPTFC